MSNCIYWHRDIAYGKYTKAALEQSVNLDSNALVVDIAGHDRHNHVMHPQRASGDHFLH